MTISTSLIGTRVRYRDRCQLRGEIVAVAYDPSENDGLVFAVLVRTDDGDLFPANATWLVCDGDGNGQHVEEPEPSLEEKFRARLASMTPEECDAALQRVRDFIDREPLEAVPRCPSCGDVELPPGWRVCGACFLREGP